MSGKKGAQGNHNTVPARADRRMGRTLLSRMSSSKQRGGYKKQTNARRRRRDKSEGESW